MAEQVNQTTTPSTPNLRKKVVMAVILTALITAGLGFAVIYLFFGDKVSFTQQDQLTTEQQTTIDQEKPSEETKNQDESLVTYSNQELGITFQYPKAWGTVQESPVIGSEPDKKYPGFKFSNQGKVSFGGPSAASFSASHGGRGGVHFDAPGFINFGSKYFTLGHDMTTGEPRVSPIEGTTELNLITAINTSILWAEYALDEYYGYRYVEARVNLDTGEFYGTVFVLKEPDEATQQEFETLLQSIELI